MTGPEAGQDTDALNFSFNEGDQMVQFGIQGNDSYAENKPDSEIEQEMDHHLSTSSNLPWDYYQNQVGELA